MEILGLLDELRTMACNGLTYATNPYDRERYERLLHLTSQSYAEILDLPSEKIREQLRAELGYITPKVGADAAIFDDEGRILLHLRADDRCWCLPYSTPRSKYGWENSMHRETPRADAACGDPTLAGCALTHGWGGLGDWRISWYSGFSVADVSLVSNILPEKSTPNRKGQYQIGETATKSLHVEPAHVKRLVYLPVVTPFFALYTVT